MNKRRNKSVTKTKHRVQKTKRSRRLNKNRSVKGIRGNNKTKVVGKRRNIVQSGGKFVEELIRAIRQLDHTTSIPRQRDLYINTNIVPLFTKETGIIKKTTTLRDKASDETTDFHTPLYAACRLKTPSYTLVERMLVAEFNPRSQNGGDDKEYPQHGAIKAAKYIVESQSLEDTEKKKRISSICDILEMLKTRDSGKNPSIGSLMKLKDARYNTAYDDFLIIHDSVKRLYGEDGERIITRFETVLEKPNDPLTREEMLKLEQIDTQRLKVQHQQGSDRPPPPPLGPPLPLNIADLHPVILGYGNDFNEYTDPRSGRKYWHSLTTNVTIWPPFAIPPAHSVPDAAAAAPSAGTVPPAPAGALPDGWKEMRSADGRIYFEDTRTGHTQWERPPNPPPPQIPAQIPAIGSAAHTNSLVPGGRNGLGYQKPDAAGSFDTYKPPPFPVHVAPSSAGTVPPAAAAALPVGWKEMRSADGRIYFEDTRTGHTQWERPPNEINPCEYAELPQSKHYSLNPTTGSKFIYKGITYYFCDEMNNHIKRERSKMDTSGHARRSNFTFMYDNIQYTFDINISGRHFVKFILKSGNGNPCMVTGIFNW